MLLSACLAIVAMSLSGLIPALSKTSKFCMVMALSAIGLKTSFKDIKDIGFKPMVLVFSADALVVFVSIGIQIAIF